MLIFSILLTFLFSNVSAANIEVVGANVLLDKNTSLNWSPEIGSKTWQEAKTFCERLEHNGYKDWRLPTLTELKNAICNKNYKEGFACKDVNKKGIISYKGKDNVTYWSSKKLDSKAYYIVLNDSAVYSKSAITNTSNSRCVRGIKVVKEERVTTENEDVDNRTFKYYITPQITGGIMFSNSLNIPNRAYLGGAVDIGYMIKDKLAVKASIESGFNIQNQDYPFILTATVGPEYFFTDKLSAYVGVGIGVLRGDTNNIVSYVQTRLTETYFSVAWKAGVAFQVYKSEKFAIPLGVYYSGVLPTERTELTVHLITASAGFTFYL